MSYRNSQIFIQSQTKHRLYLVAQLYPTQTTNSRPTMIQSDSGYAGADEVADSIINAAIETHYPLVLELEKKQDALTKEFLAKAKAA